MTTLSLTITDPSVLVITGENLAVEVKASNSPETAHEAGRFESGSLTEILVKPQVQVLPGDASGVAKGGPTGMGRSDSVERHAPNSPSAAPAAEAVTVPTQTPAVTAAHSNSSAGLLPGVTDTAEVESSSPASAAPFEKPAPAINPDCAHPDTCQWARSMASCSPCANAATKARAA